MTCSCIFNRYSLQIEQRASLKEGLSQLPAPKNDYEIVIPEDSEGGAKGEDEEDRAGEFVEDQADLDERREGELAKKRNNSLIASQIFPIHTRFNRN